MAAGHLESISYDGETSRPWGKRGISGSKEIVGSEEECDEEEGEGEV